MDDNRYSKIMASSPDSEERRAARKKRRVRARLGSFLILFLIVGVIIASGILAGRGIVKVISSATSTSVSETVSTDEMDVTSAIEEIIGSEEIVSIDETDFIDVPTEEELYDSWIEEKINELTLEEKVMGLFIVTPEQLMGISRVTAAGEKTKNTLENYPVGGIIYSEKNIDNADQFSEMLTKSKEYVRYETFFMIREESGNTVLGKKLNLQETETSASLGETMDPYKAYETHTVIAKYLKEAGINFNIGLVGDVIYSANEDEEIDSIMKDRSFGNDPTIVSRMVTESVKAYRENGIGIAAGYFPGEGNLDKDPSESVVSTDVTSDRMLSYIQPVYEAAVEGGLDAIVVSHVYADSISSKNVPCSLSKEIYTDILRGKLGLSDTILITDALDKQSVKEYFTSQEACIDALKAGADMVMCPENFEEGYNAVLEAVKSGVIDEKRINDSIKRVWKVKYREIYQEEMLLLDLEEETGTQE